MLISIGISKSQYDKKGHLPLYYACVNQNVKMIEILTEENEDSFIQTKSEDQRKTPLNQLYKQINNASIYILHIIVSATKRAKKGNINYVCKYLAKKYTKDNRFCSAHGGPTKECYCLPSCQNATALAAATLRESTPWDMGMRTV